MDYVLFRALYVPGRGRDRKGTCRALYAMWTERQLHGSCLVLRRIVALGRGETSKTEDRGPLRS
jgi:hypothetical protein